MRLAKSIPAPLACGLYLGLTAFLNACFFPLYDLSGPRPLILTLLILYLAVSAAKEAGSRLAARFPQRGILFIAAITAATACVGLAGRYLLEYGEVSNTRNFTVPNIALHLCVFVGLTLLHFHQTAKARQQAA